MRTLNAITLRVYEAMKQKILLNALPSGAKVNQAEMANLLETSRTPVVYALHKLESEGLVDNVPNSGFYVHRIHVKELLDMFILREAIEGIVIEDIAVAITTEQIAGLRECFRRFRSAAVPIDEREYRIADIRFHSLLLESCGNDLVKKINDNFQVLNRTYTAGLLRPPEITIGEHESIVDALAQHDAKTARERMSRHLATTRNTLQGVVNHLRSVGIDPNAMPLEDIRFGGKTPVGSILYSTEIISPADERATGNLKE